MWGVSWANLLMYTASIPGYNEDQKKESEDEDGIDTKNWQQYL